MLFAIAAGVFLAVLDQTVVVTALPQIFIDISLPVTKLDEGAWIVTGYLICYTAAMPHDGSHLRPVRVQVDLLGP